MQIIFTIFFLIVGIVPSEVHEFHFSKSMLKYNSSEQAWQLSMHVYIDDFEKAMNLEGMDSLYLCSKKENPNAELLIESYINQFFQIQSNGQVIKLKMVGKEVAEDILGMWIYAEAENQELPTKIMLNNTILNKLYDDQKNMVNIHVGESNEYILFDQKTVSKSLTF